MPTFSERSIRNLRTCDARLQEVLWEAIDDYDFSVVQGHRGREDQNRAYDEGFSKLQWPNSAHNKDPSRAVDIIPYPSGYEDINEFNRMATYIFAAANKVGVKIIWGGHWKNFKDYPHFEMVN